MVRLDAVQESHVLIGILGTRPAVKDATVCVDARSVSGGERETRPEVIDAGESNASEMDCCLGRQSVRDGSWGMEQLDEDGGRPPSLRPVFAMAKACPASRSSGIRA